MLIKITDGVDVGATDFRKQILGLIALVQSKFKLYPYSTAYLFLFCNKRRTAINTLRYDFNGFLLA